ncbi:hypothetical protein D1816_02420 [Aquimarina sp. AD10]|uniref:hypothetical protein n=1 Tax=Aquimarina sp. AD10 TaxID=1714849 RepID=UPI000E4C8DB4|nr:hypothetical protein [Aquimarina sp. AD10]AXT59249.1 hypothetical protein D1816_02420 [Aquimarina sp. AD10]RKM91865.1 hypothetical protein D7033_21775 [Aquimarina sp. AD10]
MGLYAPIVKGEIEGLKIGLDTNLILWEHTRTLEYDKLKGEWLVGFGVGFNKGQTIRKKLTENVNDKILKKRVSSILFLLAEIPYSEFETVLLNNLENLKNWESEHLTKEIVSEVESLIEQDKLQQALTQIKVFYQNQKALTALMNYSQLPNELSKLRQSKQRNEINNEVYLLEKQKIKFDLKKWIEINKN